MIVLGIETSCDETAAALVHADRRVLGHVLSSQVDLHQRYGGVVPEIASRNHLEILPHLVERLFDKAGLAPDAVDGVAVTTGPGLVGGVMVGMMYAKGYALVQEKPFIAVNHLEGHALTPRLTHDVAFPYLLLLMSGGHTQFLVAHDVGSYTLLGTSRDDALGETFDKTARLLGLPYPGGPQIEREAQGGNPQRFLLPRPLCGQEGCDFSFSGLKTSVLRLIQERQQQGPLTPADIRDVAASFQETVAHILEDRLKGAILKGRHHEPTLATLVLAGGVAANRLLYHRMVKASAALGMEVVVPEPALCTDNGVMIAWAGIERLRRGLISDLGVAPRPRWPLEMLSGPREARESRG